jgi:hypothetical protein
VIVFSNFLKSPDPELGFCHSGFLTEIKGRLFSCWYIYSEEETKGGKVVLSYSDDDGTTFSNAKVLFPEITKSQGNPVLFGDDKIIYLLFAVITEKYWNDAKLYYSTSINNGIDWTEPQLLSEEEGLMVRHSPIFYRKSWLLPLYKEKSLSSHIFKFDSIQKKITSIWDFPGKLIQPQIVEDGNLEIYFRTAGQDFSIWKSTSNERADAFSTPMKIGLACPKSGNAVSFSPAGRLVAFNDSKGIKRTPLSLCNIRTLNIKGNPVEEKSNIWDIEKAELEFSYPSLYVSGNVTHLQYSYNRKFLKYSRFENIERHFSYKSELKNYSNLHRGKNLFILASGPSLADLDMEPLSRRLTMGLNRSFLIYQDTKYHCTMDARLLDAYPDEYSKVRKLFSLPNCSEGERIELLGTEGFSKDLEEGIYSGYTVSYFALQIAAYMGFKRIFFLGLDLCHRNEKTHFFGHDFRSENHENGEFEKMATMLTKGKEVCDQLGIEVYNCSEITSYKGIPYISYEDALKF